MKFLPAIFLTLTLVARTESESTELCCTGCNTHQEVVSLLHGIYEEENCSIVESTNGDFRMTCSYDVPNWKYSHAEYHAKSCECEYSYIPKWYAISYGSNGASSWESTDLEEGCFDDNGILPHVSPYMDKPDEAPIPSEAPFSEAPYSKVPTSSDAPISEAPFTEEPSSWFPSAGYPSSEPGCGNPSDHRDVVNTLFNTFGRRTANCQKTASTMDCEAQVFGYTASANYRWELRGDLNYPVELTVTSTYTDPEHFSSFMELIDFEEACLDDSDSHLSGIRRVLNERSCPNASGSFAFKRDQELTCLELAGLRLGKLQRVCASENYPDFRGNCRGVCRTGQYCQCVDNPVAFPVGRNGKTMTCQEVAELNDAKKARKCSRTKIQENCPTACGIGVCASA